MCCLKISHNDLPIGDTFECGAATSGICSGGTVMSIPKIGQTRGVPIVNTNVHASG